MFLPLGIYWQVTRVPFWTVRLSPPPPQPRLISRFHGAFRKNWRIGFGAHTSPLRRVGTPVTGEFIIRHWLILLKHVLKFVILFRHCETTENVCTMIEDLCVNSNECMKGVNSYTCRYDNYQDTNPYNCSITRENCVYFNLWKQIFPNL